MKLKKPLKIENSNFQSAIGKIQVLIVKDDKSKVSFVKNIGDKVVVISPSQISISHGTGFTYSGYSIIDMDKADFRGSKTAKNKGVKLSDSSIGKAGNSGIQGYLKNIEVPVPFRVFTANGVKYRLINLPQESNRTGIEYNISDINISTTIGEKFEYYKVGFALTDEQKAIIDLNSTLAKVKAKNQEWNLSLRPIGAIDFAGAALKIPVSALKFEDDKNTTLSIGIKVFEEFGLDEVNKTALNFIFNRPPEALTSEFNTKRFLPNSATMANAKGVDTELTNSNDINFTWNEDYKQYRLELAESEFNGSNHKDSGAISKDGNGTVVWLLIDKDNTKKGKDLIKIKKVEAFGNNVANAVNTKGAYEVNGSVIPITEKPFKLDFNYTTHITTDYPATGSPAGVSIAFETNGTYSNGKVPLRITFEGNGTETNLTKILSAKEVNTTVTGKYKFPVRVTFVDTEGAKSSFDFNISLSGRNIRE